MGFGDEIMALGRVERHYEATGLQAAIVDRLGNRRTHDLWRHNPAWNPDAENSLTDGPGARPYIKRWELNQTIYELSHRPRAGKVHLTQSEIETAADLDFQFAVVSPHVKENASCNKDWGFERWAQVVENFPIPVFQLGTGKDELLPGAMFFKTETMRHAAAVVERAALVMTNEGGLHHLAASMGRKAVVIHGGFTAPEVTGYKWHANLTGNTKHSGCGKWAPCSDCRNALDKITPSVVKLAAEGLLYG